MPFLSDLMATVLTLLTVIGLAVNGYINELWAAIIMVFFVASRSFVRGSCSKTVFGFLFFFAFIIIVLIRRGSLTELLSIIISSVFSGTGWVLNLYWNDPGNFFLFLIFFILLNVIFKRRDHFKDKFKNNLIPNTLYIGITVALLIIFLGSYGGSQGETIALGGYLLAMLLSLGGVYLMVKGFSSSRRR